MRGQALLFDETEQFGEFRARAEGRAENLQLADEEAAQVRRRVVAGGRAASDETPAAHERAHRRGPHRLADVLDDDVDAAPVGELHHPIDDLAARVMDRLGSAQRPRALELLRVARGDDRPRADGGRDLGRSERDRSADSEDENRFAGREARLRPDHAPCGQPGDAERGALDEIERLGLAKDARLGSADEACERPVDLLAENARLRAEHVLAPSAELACSAGLDRIEDDRVARAKRRAGVGLFDHARAVEPEDDRQPVGDPRAAIAHVEVDAVEAARDHADQQVAGLALRNGHIVEAQDFGAAVAVNARCEHRHRASPKICAQNLTAASSVACGRSM